MALAYDPDGLRVSSQQAGGPARTHAWDRVSHGLPMALTDGPLAFLYGPDGRPYQQVDGDGTATFLHSDALGSVRLVTSATGTVVTKRSYSSRGDLTSGSAAATPFGWASEHADTAAAGLVYLRARWYDPKTAQFLNTDPIADVTRDPYGYGYGDGDPIGMTDPSGLFCLPSFGSATKGGRCQGARTLRNISGKVNMWSGRVAAASAVTALACPICAPIALASGAVTLGTGLVKTGIDCQQGFRNLDPCVASTVGTAIDLTGLRIGFMLRASAGGSRLVRDANTALWNGFGISLNPDGEIPAYNKEPCDE